jgi:hypothetical protein
MNEKDTLEIRFRYLIPGYGDYLMFKDNIPDAPLRVLGKYFCFISLAISSMAVYGLGGRLEGIIASLDKLGEVSRSIGGM